MTSNVPTGSSAWVIGCSLAGGSDGWMVRPSAEGTVAAGAAAVGRGCVSDWGLASFGAFIVLGLNRTGGERPPVSRASNALRPTPPPPSPRYAGNFTAAVNCSQPAL